MEVSKRLKEYFATLKGGWATAGVIFGVLSAYDLISGQLPSLNLPTFQDLIYWLDWKVWLIVTLSILLIGALEGSFRYKRQCESNIPSLNQACVLVQREIDSAQKHLNTGSLSNVSSSDKNLIMAWSIRMLTEHGHEDAYQMLADRASGIPLNRIMYQSCSRCQQPRNIKSKTNYI